MSDNIILHPERDIQAQVYSDSNIVHKREMDQVLNLIHKMKESYRDYDPFTRGVVRVHNTITLSGGRGSGKTSFLQSLIAQLEPEKCKDIEILDIVDPTLIEEKGHIFLNIVARIKDRVERRCGIENPFYRDWESVLNSLAAGLPMLDGINGGLDPSDWNDTTFVMHDGLRRVSGANNLEQNFHRYVNLSLKLLNKKFLLIAFDDVDTDFAKGWPVLETLRKYFTSPQILTFLSGDMNLYSVLVRKRQWKNFGKSLLKNEYDKNADRELKIDDYMSLVETLEGQYILKLLKPEYRITLSTLASKLATGNIDIKVGNDNLLNFYEQSLKSSWGIIGSNTQCVYLRFLTSLPLRTQLALLNIFTQFIKGETTRYDLTSDVANIFYSELRCANVDIWELLNGGGLINIYLLKFLLDNNVLDEASQFFPKLNKPSLNGAIIALGAILSGRLSKDPFELFDHIIRISSIVSKATKWPIEGSSQEENIKDFVQHSRSLFDYGLKKTASMQSAYILSFEKNMPKDNGLIPIKAMSASKKKKRDESDPSLDDVFNGSDLDDFLGFLPAVGVQDQLGRTNNFYSFFNILGAIGDIIQHPSIKEMRNEVIRMAQLREYPVFFNKNSFTENEFNAKEDYRSLDTSENETITKFVEQLDLWKKTYKEILLPPYLLGRIMVRTSYSFTRIEPTPEWKIADLLHKQIIVFLNAILVEEVMERYGNERLILTNPTKSDDIFIKNYQRNTDSNHPLFDFIFACPLIRPYLNPQLFNQVSQKEGYSREISVYERLRAINIKGLSRILKQMTIDRTIQPNNSDHIDVLINNFKNMGIEKDALDSEIVKKVIKKTFTNKIVTNAVLEETAWKLKESTKW